MPSPRSTRRRAHRAQGTLPTDPLHRSAVIRAALASLVGRNASAGREPLVVRGRPERTSSRGFVALTVRQLASVAVAGALVFPLLLLVVAAIQWDFLHDRGWRVFDHGDVTWPSGTALGPHGYLQVVNFVVLGLALLALAVALARSVQSHRNAGAWLVGLMGLALLLSAIRIDHPSAFGGEGSSPDTWNGVVHGVGFFLLLLATLASMITLGFQFRRDPRWRHLAPFSFGAAIALPVAFLGVSTINGAVGFYLFLAVILAWIIVLALRASRVASTPVSDR